MSLAPVGQGWHAKTCSDGLGNIELGVGATYKGVAFLVLLGEDNSSRSQQVEGQVIPLLPWGPL